MAGVRWQVTGAGDGHLLVGEGGELHPVGGEKIVPRLEPPVRQGRLPEPGAGAGADAGAGAGAGNGMLPSEVCERKLLNYSFT